MNDGTGLAERLLGRDGFRVLEVTETPYELVFTVRIPVEFVGCCRQVGELARPVSKVPEELGVCWWTVMNAVVEHSTPLVDDPDRIGAVNQLGIDETSFLAANRSHATVYVTGLVDLEAKVVIDMVEGNVVADLRRWTAKADPGWLAGIEVVATDLAESFGAGLSPHLKHARQVVDPFHVVRPGNRCLDKVRRRAQNETPGHRAASATRSTASASCCSPAMNASTRPATSARCWACRWPDPGTRSWAHGWPRNQ